MGKRKKKRFSRIIFIAAIFLSISAVCFYYFNNDSRTFIYYKSFGIEIPVNYSIHGIDVSKHQEKIHWKSVSDMKVDEIKIDFVFIKATEGVESVDKKYKSNWSKAKNAGLYTGAYHFFLCSKSGKDQARNFINTVKLQPGDLPPVLDVEEPAGVSPGKINKEVREWLMIVEKYYGVKPLIYTNIVFYNTYLAGKFDGYPLWIAHYEERNRPRIKRDWLFWQHNETGKVNGIRSDVDFNVFNGDSMDFQEILIK